MSGESAPEQKFQTASGKSGILPSKSLIQQTLSVKFQKYETVSRKSTIPQTVSAKFDPILSWSHYCDLLKVEGPLARSF